jgi:hypothetical protein
MFRSGQIQELYNESNQVKSRTPQDLKDSPAKIQRCAQIAADNDNKKTCNARLTQTMPVASIDDENIDVLYGLCPKSYNIEVHKPHRDTRSSTTKHQISVSPKSILDILNHCKRGKAPGIELDSLDIFIKLAGAYKKSKKKHQIPFIRVEILSKFFSILANGDVPPRIKRILRTTYMCALHKDPTNKRKLRPLGIPSAIRRITAICILHQYKGQFAKYLAPFNYAFGVHGGVDFVANTMRLGVDKYITTPENKGEIPSRALISLDIRNMFNAMSRQKLRQLIYTDFPELENFADCFYEEFGQTVVRRSDGTWESIPVEEGFSQGCPVSPVFAAIVLTHILRKIHHDLTFRAFDRVSSGNIGDDGCGGIPVIMTYVDDCNALVPHEDVKLFLDLFEKYGGPLGAKLNTEKTRILTSTSGRSILPRLLFWPSTYQTGVSIWNALGKYSRELDKDTGNYKMCEKTDGLRILGVPIGCKSFCDDFIMQTIKQAVSNCDKIIDGLDSDQTVLQIFRACTAHKMTHLFAADVLNHKLNDMPRNWFLWESDMADAFSDMIDKVLSAVTRRPSIPAHAHLIAIMSTKAGGLGIPHPRSTAIPTFILNTKRCIQYATDGIWIDQTTPKITLPYYITNLYSNWETSDAHLFQVFRKYIKPISNICVSELVDDDPVEHFIHKSSLNNCRERIKLKAASRICSSTSFVMTKHPSIS